MYTKEIMTKYHINDGSYYTVHVVGDRLSITNGMSYDSHEGVTLSLAEQVALLHILADHLGVTIGEGLDQG